MTKRLDERLAGISPLLLSDPTPSLWQNKGLVEAVGSRGLGRLKTIYAFANGHEISPRYRLGCTKISKSFQNSIPS